METKREWLYCHACHNVQRDRRAYWDHLLRVHGEVARRGSDIHVRLEARELEVVWASAHRSRISGPVRTSRRREALGLPRVSDRAAERCPKDNRACTAPRHRAAACAREGVPSTLTTPEVLVTPDGQEATAGDTRQVLLLGSTQADPPKTAPPGRTYSPCARCLNCLCRQSKNNLAAQDTSPSPARRSRASRRRSSSSRRGQRRPPRTPSPGLPSFGTRPSRMRGPPTALTDGPSSLGTTPRPSSAWGQRP